MLSAAALGVALMTARRRREGRDFSPHAEAMDRGGDHEERVRALEVPETVAWLHIKLFDDDETVEVTTFTEAIAEDMDGLSLRVVELFLAEVSTSGIVRVQIHNVSNAVDLLSTRIQIDANEFHSDDAATDYVIDVDNRQVFFKERVRVEVDDAGTGAKGLGIHLGFW
jgi:hypothetical protein